MSRLQLGEETLTKKSDIPGSENIPELGGLRNSIVASFRRLKTRGNHTTARIVKSQGEVQRYKNRKFWYQTFAQSVGLALMTLAVPVQLAADSSALSFLFYFSLLLLGIFFLVAPMSHLILSTLIDSWTGLESPIRVTGYFRSSGQTEVVAKVFTEAKEDDPERYDRMKSEYITANQELVAILAGGYAIFIAGVVGQVFARVTGMSGIALPVTLAIFTLSGIVINLLITRGFKDWPSITVEEENN